MSSQMKAISSAERLEALRQTGLMDSPSELAFDRVTGFATRLMGAPVSLMSLVDEDRQFFKSAAGLPDHLSSVRETPLSHSFCQHVVNSAQPLVIENAASHPLVKDNLAVRDLGVAAYLGVPLTTPDGMTLGALCAIDTKPHAWSDDDIQRMTELAGIVMNEIALRDEILKRNKAEAHQKFLIGELGHRVTNTFALVDGVIGLSLRTSSDLPSFAATLRSRIKSLATTHAMAFDQTRETIDLSEIVRAEIQPLTQSNVSVSGPSVGLQTNSALYFSMGIHELLTNSMKYGALSVPEGRVEIEWSIEGTDSARVLLSWKERGGPAVRPPTRSGFGTLLFEKILGPQLRGQAVREFAPEGVTARLDIGL